MNRSLLAAIGTPLVVLAVTLVFLLTAGPGSGAAGHAAAAPAVTGGAAASPSPASRRRPQPAMPRPGGHFVGIAVNGDIAGSVRSFSRATHVHPALVELYALFGAPFPALEASRVDAAGSVPFVQWDPRSAPLAEIAQGGYNAYLRGFARAVKAFGNNIVLSFAHEMNGSWYPWGRLHATPAQFIAAWHRIHTVFANQHVTNVTWSWDPSHSGSPASPWWPGAAYVNWIGIDGYLRPGQTFGQIFAQQLANIRSVTGDPIFIAETAVSPGPSQGQQVGDLFSGLSQYHLLGFVWFDINRLQAWHLEGRPAAIRAFRRAARSLRIGA